MNRFRKMALIGLTSAAVLATTTACGSDSSDAGGGLTTFRSVIFPGETYALDYIADEKGFFEDNGLKVTYLSPQSGSSAVQMLAAGEVDGWATAPSIVYNAAAQGQPVKLAGLIPSFAAYELLIGEDIEGAQPDGTFDEKVESLGGKTIGVSGLAAGTDLSLLAALDSVGMGEKDVERLGVGTTLSGLGQLKAGAIDAYVDFTGSGARLIEKEGAGERYLQLYGEDAPEQVDALSDLALAVNGDWAKENPELLEAWLTALGDARAWLEDEENLPEAAKIIADASYKGENVDEVTESLEELAGRLQTVGDTFEPDPTRVELQIDVLKKIGGLKADAEVTPSSVIVE